VRIKNYALVLKLKQMNKGGNRSLHADALQLKTTLTLP
jgi:hypothetical protein